jgi:hypothetical protein
VLKQGVVLERLQDVEALMEAIHLEQKHMRELKKGATERLEGDTWKSKQSDWGIGTLRKQELQKATLIKVLEEQGQDVYKEKIKMEGIQEQLAEEELKVAAAIEELQQAEAAMESLTRGLHSRQLQFDALAAEKFQLKTGRSSLNFWPRPMVYLPSDPLPSCDFSDESKFIRITTCSLCSFPFPQNDIVVSSCKHLYHPFCASVVFVRNCKCMAIGCGELSHPEWHRSFGWGEPTTELSERALMLGLAEERRRIMQERTDQARARVPGVGKFTLEFLLGSAIATSPLWSAIPAPGFGLGYLSSYLCTLYVP